MTLTLIEDLLCVKGVENTDKNKGKYTVLTINDGGHGQDDTIAVIDNRVHRLVFDDRKIMLQVIV